MSEWSDLPHFERLPLSANTRDEQERATRYVAGSALDADDCRQLLDMVGLLATAPRVHGIDGFRQGCICKRCRAAGSRKHTTPPTTTTTDAPVNTRKENP